MILRVVIMPPYPKNKYDFEGISGKSEIIQKVVKLLKGYGNTYISFSQ